jgi:hypothetical protein
MKKVKVGEWMKILEKHPQKIEVLYAGMINKDVFSLVIKEYRIGGYLNESPNLFYSKECKEIQIKGVTIQILSVTADEIHIDL